MSANFICYENQEDVPWVCQWMDYRRARMHPKLGEGWVEFDINDDLESSCKYPIDYRIITASNLGTYIEGFTGLCAQHTAEARASMPSSFIIIKITSVI